MAAAEGESIEIETGPRTRGVEMTFTWFGLVMEGAVAAAFLAPLRARWMLFRAATLIGFCLTTYTVVPVAGFAVLLLTMSFAQSSAAITRRLHVAAGVLILLWDAAFISFIL